MREMPPLDLVECQPGAGEPVHQRVDRLQIGRRQIPVQRRAVELGAEPAVAVARCPAFDNLAHEPPPISVRYYRRPRTRGITSVGHGSGISPTGTSIRLGPRRFSAAFNSRRNSAGLVARIPATPKLSAIFGKFGFNRSTPISRLP